MKCQIPQISWHGRDPVLSVDFQASNDSVQRLATGGTDTHVFIWYVVLTPNKPINLEFASDLNRHSKPVNIVRFSPNGEILASGDDESCIILWKPSEREVIETHNEEENTNKEHWYPLKVLRGHLDDICDISWSPDSSCLLSGSVDNTAIMWDIPKGKKTAIFSEYNGFVQGVSWDPSGQYLASISSDRILRIHNLNTRKTTYKVQKAILSPEKNSGKPSRLFYDDTLKSFCRRLSFSPDGELLIVPSGIIDLEEGKLQNTTYVFTRHSLNKPVLHLPTGSKYTLAVRCSPVLYKLREPKVAENSEICGEQTQTKSLFSLPYRVVFAVAAQDSIFLYDTQQALPFAYVSNIHYTHLSDLAWSPDGLILIASSTDGYCSFIMFNKGEIGEPYEKPVTDAPAAKETSDSVKSSSPAPANTAADNIPSPCQLDNAPDVKEKPVETKKSPESPTSKSATKVTPGVKKNSIMNFLVSPATKKNSPECQGTRNEVEDMDVDQHSESPKKNLTRADVPVITIDDDDSSEKMDCDTKSSVVFVKDTTKEQSTDVKNDGNIKECVDTLCTEQEMKTDDKPDVQTVVATSVTITKVLDTPHSPNKADNCAKSNAEKLQISPEPMDLKSPHLQDGLENPVSQNSGPDISKTHSECETSSKVVPEKSELPTANKEPKTVLGSNDGKKSGRRIQLITLSGPLKS